MIDPVYLFISILYLSVYMCRRECVCVCGSKNGEVYDDGKVVKLFFFRVITLNMWLTLIYVFQVDR